MAREKFVSAYVGDRLNRSAAMHQLDALVYGLVLKKANDAVRFHGVPEVKKQPPAVLNGSSPIRAPLWFIPFRDSASMHVKAAVSVTFRSISEN